MIAGKINCLNHVNRFPCLISLSGWVYVNCIILLILYFYKNLHLFTVI